MEIREIAKEERLERNLMGSQVCMGLCSESLYRNYEIGKRTLDVYVQNRLMERLGYSTKRMYYVLKPPAWECWHHRMGILYALVRGEMETAKERIEMFAATREVKKPLHRQYLCRMQAFYEMCNGGEKANIADYLEQALSCTVPGFATKDYQNQSLATCEVDMLLDWYYYKTEQMPEDFLEIADYCEKIGFDEVQMGQVYPKAIWYAYEVAKQKQSLTERQSTEILEYCSLLKNALQHLRKQKNGYYLWEVLSANEEILHVVKERKLVNQDTEKQYEQCKKYLQVLSQMYDCIKKEKVTVANFLPYIMYNADGICECIAKRMKMFGYTAEKMASEVNIDVRTVSSIISGARKPSKKTVDAIFEKLHLPVAYTREEFTIESKEQKRLVEEINHCELYGSMKEGLKKLEELEEKFDLEDENNFREFCWRKVWFLYATGRLSKEQCAIQIKQMIEETIEWGDLFRDGAKYFTEYEFCYLCGYLQVAERNKEYDSLFRMVEAHCNEKMGNYEELAYAPLLGMMVDTIQSEYGNSGKFDISNHYCWRIIDFSYYIKDMARIEDSLYGIWWNKKEETKTADKEMLSWIIELAELIEDFSGREFMLNVKNQL